MCRFENRTRASARLYADAFAADAHLADDLRLGHRFKAACAAAAAGCGHGKDAAALDELERVSWRKQARDWLRADLIAWEATLTTGPGAGHAVHESLSRWQVNPELADLREPEALKHLPADEREECIALWKEVATVLKRAERAVKSQ